MKILVSKEKIISLVNFLLERKNKAVLGIMLFVLLGFVPNGPLMLFPTVVVIPLLLALGMALSGVKFKGSEILTEIFVLSLLLSGFLVLKSVGIRPSITDENIYFYMARNLIQGFVPYRDFFFAHPPGHILFIAPFFASGFNLMIAKLIPVVITTLSSLFIYITFRGTGYKMAGIVFVFFYLYAYQILMGSTNLNGENLMVLFLAISIFSASRNNYFFSGIASGLAISCGLYSIAGVVAIGLLVCYLSKTQRCKYFSVIKFWFGVVAIVLIVFGSSWAIAGDNFIEDVFRYHTMKTPKSGRVDIFAQTNPILFFSNYMHNLKVFWQEKTLLKSFYFHSPIYILAAGYIIYTVCKAFYLWLITLIAKRRNVVRKSEHFDWLDSIAILGVVATLLFVFQFAALNEFYDFYMIPMLFFTILPASVFVIKMLKVPLKYPDRGWLSIPVLIIIFWLSLPLSNVALRILWPQEHKHKGELVSYQWHDPIAFKSAAQLCKYLFYTNYRERGIVTPFYNHYIWNKSLGLTNINEIASFIRTHTLPNATITGASGIAPLVSLLSNVRMANDEADLNNKRFKSGLLTDNVFIQKALNDHLKYIISTPISHFSTRLMQNNPIYSDKFKRVARFIDYGVLHNSKGLVIDIYELK